MHQPRIRVRQEIVTGGTVLTVTGEIDAGTVVLLTGALVRVAAAQPTAVVTDVSAVTFIDSSGVDALLRAHHDLTACGSKLLIAGAPPAVLRVVQITGVDRVIPIYPTVGHALHP